MMYGVWLLTAVNIGERNVLCFYCNECCICFLTDVFQHHSLSITLRAIQCSHFLQLTDSLYVSLEPVTMLLPWISVFLTFLVLRSFQCQLIFSICFQSYQCGQHADRLFPSKYQICIITSDVFETAGYD